jgi:hypothetical protein
MPTPSGERSCATKNRMRELRSCGTVRDEGSNALVYSEVSRLWRYNYPLQFIGLTVPLLR